MACKESQCPRPHGSESQDGQRPSFADVLTEYQRPIYNYLLRMTQNQAQAEDLTQETFIRVHRSLPSFRGEAKLSTWIYRIATNVSTDYFRRTATRHAEAAVSLDEMESDLATYHPSRLSERSLNKALRLRGKISTNASRSSSSSFSAVAPGS